jgi:hypothetical protein
VLKVQVHMDMHLLKQLVQSEANIFHYVLLMQLEPLLQELISLQQLKILPQNNKAMVEKIKFTIKFYLCFLIQVKLIFD